MHIIFIYSLLPRLSRAKGTVSSSLAIYMAGSICKSITIVLFLFPCLDSMSILSIQREIARGGYTGENMKDEPKIQTNGKKKNATGNTKKHPFPRGTTPTFLSLPHYAINKYRLHNIFK